MQAAVAVPDEQRLSTLRFDPDALRPEERFEAFSERVRYYDVRRPSREVLSNFGVTASHWHLGGASAGRVRYAARDMVRSARHVRNDQLDHYRLIVQHEGTTELDSDGVRRTIGPGQIFLTDMARPESVHGASAGAYSVFFFPRDVIDEALPRPVDLHGLVPEGVPQAILGDHLGSVMRHLAHVTTREAAGLSQSLVAMVAATLAPSLVTREPARKAIEATLLRQACRYVELHLGEQDLNADRVAGFLRISRASVYRLFEPLGGVSAYVKERRLDRVHALLASSTTTPYLTRLADDHGFSSAAQFSRAFRDRFGYSPSDARGRTPIAVQAQDAPKTTETGLFDWLRGLRG